MCIWHTWGEIDVEAKRILGCRLFIAVLVSLVVLSCFFYLYQRPDTWEDPLVDGEVYHKQLEKLRDMSWEDAHAWCVQYQGSAQAAMMEGQWNYDSEAEEIRIAAMELQAQYEHLMDYENYLDKIQTHAKLLQSVSLFSDPNSPGYKNIVKTAKDFEKMQGVEVTAGHDLAVTEFFTDKWTDHSIIIVICVVCGLFLSERKEGLWPMIHAASGGRWKMALRRTGLLFTASWIAALALVGSRILLCGIEYHGLGEWGRTLQSISMFSNVPMPMTIGQFWLFYIAIKAIGAFWIGLVLWSILSSISDLGLALSATGLVVGVEFACTAIPSSSMFAILRYVNLFSFVDYNAVFTRYLNLSVFGTLISGSDLVLVMLPFLCITFIGLNVLIAHWKYPVAPQHRILQWFDGIAKKLDPIFAGGGETRKLLIKRRGILLLILLVLLVHKMEAPPRAYVEWDPFIQFYQQQYAGPITEEKLERMEEALNCKDENNKKGISIVLEAAKKAPEGAWIVPTAPYDAIWSNNEENYHRNTALLAMLILVLVLSPIASQERQNEMTVLLRSTSGGRKRLMLRKEILLVFIAAAVWAMVYGMELFRTIEGYGGFACLSAPAYSLTLFRSGIPLWCAIGLYYGAKLAVLIIIGQVCYFLSSRCTKNRDAMLLCTGVLLIPAAMAAIGSEIGEYVSFLLPLDCVELLW